MFAIEARSLVSIKAFSALPEAELILLPGTTMTVQSTYDGGNGLTVIQLKEVQPIRPRLPGFMHPELVKSNPGTKVQLANLTEQEAAQKKAEDIEVTDQYKALIEKLGVALSQAKKNKRSVYTKNIIYFGDAG